MPINLSWRGDEIIARGKNGREKQKGKKGGTEVPTDASTASRHFDEMRGFMVNPKSKKDQTTSSSLNVQLPSTTLK
ncbi:hypothetical protein OUZ56_033208 [Daphnia magna]|uniref:Uncharacterized protein n=1 Tax=Daphnia magna TaxID=35525 RepID=A0ABQ9ZXG7_9CRUS|nr:hypothetical protein OUZ56_033208 [Daphnia magna]